MGRPRRAGRLCPAARALAAWAACATASPLTGEGRLDLTEIDAECKGDDLSVRGRYQKFCDVSERECRAKCGEVVGCAVWVYNYMDGPNPRWDDRCCWLKGACSQPHKMLGKKRGVVRHAVPIRPQADGLLSALSAFASEGAEGVTAIALEAVAEHFSEEEAAAAAAEWLAAEDARDAAESQARPPAPPPPPGSPLEELPAFAVPSMRFRHPAAAAEALAAAGSAGGAAASCGAGAPGCG
eukprot:TRINITY_DN31737_c0_g1_i1.p1 TRINITY_DN31737_c0_g1~~TRINITY_DN31737_c0_g1_i1.p1  ORF type:complete len:262 (+),score=81.42 TRINITY_DN31737_c0_g1_i1:68-787(+)